MRPLRTIANTGSYARDQLANERTFLAWLRTALAFMGLGVLVAKFTDSEAATEIGGLLLIGVGAAILVYGTVRYERLSRLIEEGQYHTARLGPVVLGMATFSCAVAAIILVLV